MLNPKPVLVQFGCKSPTCCCCYVSLDLHTPNAATHLTEAEYLHLYYIKGIYLSCKPVGLQIYLNFPLTQSMNIPTIKEDSFQH